MHILRADVGQGRGDHRQMFGAAAAAGAASSTRSTTRPGRASPPTTGPWPTSPTRSEAKDGLAAALDLAHRSGDPRLVTLIEAFLAVADLAAGPRRPRPVPRSTRLDRAASEDGYDRFILHWAGWMLGLAEQDAAAARRWMGLQQDYLDRTGIVETWITSFSTAMCDVVDGGDVRTCSRGTLALADREGYHADADCVLVLAYAEICAGRFEVAAELVGTAMHGRFNATAHYVLYRAVLDRALREQLDAGAMAEAMARGRGRTAADALAEHGVTRTR